MSLARSSLNRGPAYVTWNSITLFTQGDFATRHAAEWKEVQTSVYGTIDKYKKDLVIKIPMRLWGAWENISVLFPTAYLAPTIGASVFGSSDLPLVINARNSDRITYANVQLTKLADLHIGVDEDLFVADVEFTAILANSTNPETSGSYYTQDTNAYSEATAAFAKTNFKRARSGLAWGALTGFTAIVPQKGVNIAWTLDLKPVVVDGLGTVDMTLDGFRAAARCIPIQPTLAQLKTQSNLESAHGTLGSATSADLTITASGQSIVLKNAFMAEHGLVFGREPLRVGEVMWETTRGFTTGAANAVATAS